MWKLGLLISNFLGNCLEHSNFPSSLQLGYLMPDSSVNHGFAQLDEVFKILGLVVYLLSLQVVTRSMVQFIY